MTDTYMSKTILFLGNVIKSIATGDDSYITSNPDITVNGKITKLMSNFIIAPNIVIDNDLRYMEAKYMRDIIKTELSIFTAIVVQSFIVMSEIYNLNPTAIINKVSRADSLNVADVNRLITRSNNLVHGTASIDFVDDFLDGDGFLPITYGTEALRNAESEASVLDVSKANNYVNTYEVQLSFTTEDNITRVITIPLIIYPNIVYEDANGLLMDLSDTNKTFSARLDEYRAGLISLADLIFATSLVADYRKKKLKDNNRFSKYLDKVNKMSFIKDLIYNNNSFSKNFNIYIFDINKKSIIERQLKGSIYKDKNKDKLTDKLMAFSISFVDDSKEEVLTFIDSLPGFSVVDYSMLTKDKNADVNDILKEFIKNKQPF